MGRDISDNIKLASGTNGGRKDEPRENAISSKGCRDREKEKKK